MNTKRSGVTVWTDEHGVTREYREVKRRARVGDLVIVTQADEPYHHVGDIGRVIDVFSDDVYVDFNGFGNKSVCGDGIWFIGGSYGDYVVLEPTNIIHHDGKRWCEVKRDPKHMDWIIKNGVVYRVRERSKTDKTLVGMYISTDPNNTGYVITDLVPGTFSVIEPVEISQPPDNEWITNLEVELNEVKRRVAVLEELLRVEQIALADLSVQSIYGSLYRPNEPSKPLTREQVVEMAKKDVEELIRIGKTAKETLRGAREPFEYYFFHVKFVENRNKRTVVALVYEAYYSGRYDKKTPPVRGIAKCAPDDCFNIHIGRAIALRRALGLDVPDYYVNAPQPTEAQVGDIVWSEYDNGSEDEGARYVVIAKRSVIEPEWDKRLALERDFVNRHLRRIHIIDDSHDFGGSQPQPNAKGRAAA